MILIVFLTLFIKSLSFSIISNYSGFHNFTDKENITLTIKVNRTSVDIGKNISYNISIYDFENKVPCEGIKNDSYNCTFNDSGIYSLIIENDKTNKIIMYKNIITIYDNSSDFNVTSNYSVNCFNISQPITNKNLIKIEFNQIINKSLLNFTLYSDDDNDDNITAIPYEINEDYTIIGVENQLFNESFYHLDISCQNLTDSNLTYKNILNFSNLEEVDNIIPIFESFLEKKHKKNSLNTNEREDRLLRIQFNSYNEALKKNFDSLPEIIYPPLDMKYDFSPENDPDKYKNTLKINVNTSSVPGQVILRYHYCGIEYKYYTDLHIINNENDFDNEYVLKINKIFLYIILILFI